MAEETAQQIRRTESGYRFELSGLRSAVADAMILIGGAQNIDGYNAAINHAVAALDALEDHLAPYWDGELKDAKDGKVIKGKKKRDRSGYVYIIVPTVEQYEKEHPEIDDPDDVKKAVNEIRLQALREQQRKRYRALMNLMDRKNLLLEEETGDYAG